MREKVLFLRREQTVSGIFFPLAKSEGKKNEFTSCEINIRNFPDMYHIRNATCNRCHNLTKFEIIYCYPPRSYFKGQMRKWNNDVIHYLLVFASFSVQQL